MASNYAEIRDEIRTGDLVFFEALGPFAWLTARWGRKLATLGGTLSNWAILTGQLMACPAQWRDGMWRFVHCGMACRSQRIAGKFPEPGYEFDELLLFESLNPGGPRLARLSERIRDYPGRVLIVPLRNVEPRLQLALQAAIRSARHDAYRYDLFGLLGVLGGLGIDSPDAVFCSELVVQLLQEVGAMPTKTRIFRRGKLRSSQLRAAAFPPCRLARDSVVNLGEARLVEVGRQTSDIRHQKGACDA